jgi:hypothetical protein
VDPRKSASKIVLHCSKGVFSGHFCTTDKDIIPPIPSCIGQNEAGNFTQAALCQISRDSVADFLGTGETHTRAGGFIGSAIPGLKQKRRRTLSECLCGAKKIGTARQDSRHRKNRQ